MPPCKCFVNMFTPQPRAQIGFGYRFQKRCFQGNVSELSDLLLSGVSNRHSATLLSGTPRICEFASAPCLPLPAVINMPWIPIAYLGFTAELGLADLESRWKGCSCSVPEGMAKRVHSNPRISFPVAIWRGDLARAEAWARSPTVPDLETRRLLRGEVT